MPKVFSRNERFFLEVEAAYGIINNTAGTADVAAADAVRAIQFTMGRETDALVRRDKTGSRTLTQGIAGRKVGSFSTDMSLVTSGVPGTVPDADPLFQSLFGAAAASPSGTATITAITAATPAVVTTSAAHGLVDFDVIEITGANADAAINNVWAVNQLSSTTFELIGSSNATVGTTGTVDKAASKYSPVDTPLISFSAWSFRQPATAVQRAVFGCVVTEATFNLGQDIAEFQTSGPAKWFLDQKNFANATLDEKGGLTAFPVEPSSPVTAGGAIAGFKGRAVLNNGDITRIRTAQIRYGTGLDLPRDTFGNSYVDDPEADERDVQFSFNMYEDDSAGQAALEQAAIDKSTIDVVLNVGDTPGNIYVFVLRNIQLASPARDDSQRAFVQNYPDSRAFGVSLTSLDEMRLWVL